MGSDSESRNETWTHSRAISPGALASLALLDQERRGRETEHNCSHNRHLHSRTEKGPEAAASCSRPGFVFLETLQTKLRPHPAGHQGHGTVITGPLPVGHGFHGVWWLDSA